MERDDDVIDLGVASATTEGQGPFDGDDVIGLPATGLSDD